MLLRTSHLVVECSRLLHSHFATQNTRSRTNCLKTRLRLGKCQRRRGRSLSSSATLNLVQFNADSEFTWLVCLSADRVAWSLERWWWWWSVVDVVDYGIVDRRRTSAPRWCIRSDNNRPTTVTVIDEHRTRAAEDTWIHWLREKNALCVCVCVCVCWFSSLGWFRVGRHCHPSWRFYSCRLILDSLADGGWSELDDWVGGCCVTVWRLTS